MPWEDLTESYVPSQISLNFKFVTFISSVLGLELFIISLKFSKHILLKIPNRIKYRFNAFYHRLRISLVADPTVVCALGQGVCFLIYINIIQEDSPCSKITLSVAK